MIDSQLSALDGFKEEAINKMGALTKDEATARELLGAVDAKCQELLGEKVQELKLVDGEPLKKKLMECLEMSATELADLLKKEYPKWKEECGLELAVHMPTGKCEWVLPKDKKAFEANGMAATEPVHIDGAGAAGGTGGGGTHPGPGKGREEAGKAKRSPGYLGYFLGR
jgi:hypothetical protein